MKIEKEVIIDGIDKPKKLDIYICDECGEKFGNRDTIQPCFICGKDVCDQYKCHHSFRTGFIFNNKMFAEDQWRLCNKHRYDERSIKTALALRYSLLISQLKNDAKGLACEHVWVDYIEPGIIISNQEKCTKCGVIRFTNTNLFSYTDSSNVIDTSKIIRDD